MRRLLSNSFTFYDSLSGISRNFRVQAGQGIGITSRTQLLSAKEGVKATQFLPHVTSDSSVNIRHSSLSPPLPQMTDPDELPCPTPGFTLPITTKGRRSLPSISLVPFSHDPGKKGRRRVRSQCHEFPTAEWEFFKDCGKKWTFTVLYKWSFGPLLPSNPALALHRDQWLLTNWNINKPRVQAYDHLIAALLHCTYPE